MQLGDLIRVISVSPGVHPVGVITKVVEESEFHPRHMMCLYLDGDYEILLYETDFEVLSENRRSSFS